METVTRIRAGASPGEDRYGNPLPGVDVEEDFYGTAVALGDFAESTEVGRQTTTADLTLLWPGREVEGRSDDRWRVRGETYEAIGPAFHWVNPWRFEAHGTVQRLRSVDG